MSDCIHLAPAARRFLDRLGLQVPVLQAPMAGYQAAGLAAAVAGAGGLGALPGAALAPAVLADELRQLHRLRPGAAVNLNFFAHNVPAPDPVREQAWRAALQPYFEEFGLDPAAIASQPGRLPFGDEAAALVETLRPEVVSFHFGLPAPELLVRVRHSGAQVWSTATTVAEARWLVAHGVDAIIAQGLEAGGHRGMFLAPDLSGQLETRDLLDAVVAAVDVPVIAAGGIADAADVDDALARGACAVQVGTAFLLCPEASTSAVHRAELATRAARLTALTNLFTGRPARGIVNRLMRELGPFSALAPAFPLAVAALAPLRAAAEAQGRGDFSPLWAGTGAPACRAVPAAAVVQALVMGR